MKYINFITAVLICFFILAKCTSIVDTKEKELAVIAVPNKDYKLKVICIPSNATIQSSIQVRKLQNGKMTEEVLRDYERYNYVDTMYLKNDTTFLIIVRDTISYLGNRPDTMTLILK